MCIRIFITLFLLLSTNLAYGSWSEYKNIRHMDVNGEVGDEVIIEAKHGAGTGLYVEDMRIFRDDYPKLELIFHIRTLQSYFDYPKYNFDEIAEVKFTESSPKDGTRDIIVHSKTIYYKDDKHKVVDKEEDAGVKIFKWNGKKFVEEKGKGSTPRR